jgi:hypothetical protein
MDQMAERPLLPVSRERVSNPTEERLLTLLSMAIDWMRFAEQRHNWLILLGSALLALLLSLVNSTTDPNPRYVMGVAAGIITCGLLVSVLSFFAANRISVFLAGKQADPSESDDLYYYDHIARYVATDLVRGIERWYLDMPDDEIEVTRGELDLAQQVIVNARATVVKMRLFSIAVLCFAAGGLTTLASAIAALIW